MNREFNVSSFVIFFGLVGSLFIYAGLMKIIGDLIGLLVYDNKIKGFFETYVVLIISWVATLILLLPSSRGFFKKKDLRISTTIGVVASFVLLPALTFGISPLILFGSLNFNFESDYIDIARNVTIGTISILIMMKLRKEPTKVNS